MDMRPYEVVYIIDPDLTQEQTEAMVERFRALAEAQGVQELRVDTTTLGRRKLAYVIDHKRDGLYVVMQFLAEPAAPAEVERVLRITDGVLRTMVVRLDEMPPEPVAPPPAPEPAMEPEPEEAEAAEDTEPQLEETADQDEIAAEEDTSAGEPEETAEPEPVEDPGAETSHEEADAEAA